MPLQSKKSRKSDPEDPSPVEPEVDKTELEAAIREAQTLAASDYTAESWAAFQSALEKAVEISGSAAADENAVAQALADLNNAISNLRRVENPDPEDPNPVEPGVDKTELEAAIREAQTLAASDYTAESWAAFQSALERATEISGSATADENAVAQALADLNNAIGNLRRAENPNPGNPDPVNPGMEEQIPDNTNTASESKAVSTGDSFESAGYVLLMMTAGVAAVAVCLRRKARKQDQ